MYFEVKVKFPEQVGEKIVNITEVYVVEADLFGEAEAIAINHAPSAAEVVAIKISSIENFINHTPDLEGECPFFHFENKDVVDDGEKQVKRTIKALVHGFEVDDSKQDFIKFLDLMGADVKITKIQQTDVTKIIKKGEEEGHE